MWRGLRFGKHDRAVVAVIAAALCAVFIVVSLSGRRVHRVSPPAREQIAELRDFAVSVSDTMHGSVPVEISRPAVVPHSGFHSHRVSQSANVRSYEVIHKLSAGEQVDLNCGDTSLLKRVPGVGSVLARRIVRYGELLGGYVSPAQAAEVYGLSSGMEKWFCVGNVAPRKINLNRATYAEMLRHPYFNVRQVRAVIRRRDLSGRISGLAQMRLDTVFAEKDIKRLAPYVEF